MYLPTCRYPLQKTAILLGTGLSLAYGYDAVHDARLGQSHFCPKVQGGAVHVQPGVTLLRGHCRSVMSGLEQPHRPALEDHVHRPARLGASVLINAGWYN